MAAEQPARRVLTITFIAAKKTITLAVTDRTMKQ